MRMKVCRHIELKTGSLWGMMRGVGGVKKSIHRSWLAKGLGLGLLCWGFKGVQEEILSEEAAVFKSAQWHFQQDNAPVHNSILVTDYLSKMGIKTVPQHPYVVFWPSTQPNMPFQSDAPEGSDTFQWPVIERNHVGGFCWWNGTR